jgi:phosphoglycolate phosphatase-like HAD superfamily hydrolase
MHPKPNIRNDIFSRVDWVIFDADNTLWDLESLYHHARDKLCQLLGSFGYDASEAADYQRQRDLELFKVYGRAPSRFPHSFLDTLLHFNPADLPLNVHPAAVRASANVTPFGAVSVPA